MYISKVSYSNYKAQKEAFYEIHCDVTQKECWPKSIDIAVSENKVYSKSKSANAHALLVGTYDVRVEEGPDEQNIAKVHCCSVRVSGWGLHAACKKIAWVLTDISWYPYDVIYSGIPGIVPPGGYRILG